MKLDTSVVILVSIKTTTMEQIVAAIRIQLWWLRLLVCKTRYYKTMSLALPHRMRYLARAPWYPASMKYKASLDTANAPCYDHDRIYQKYVSVFQNFSMSDEGSVFVCYLTDVERRIFFNRYIRMHTNGTDAEYRYLMVDRAVRSMFIEKIEALATSFKIKSLPRLVQDLILYRFVKTLSSSADTIIRAMRRYSRNLNLERRIDYSIFGGANGYHHSTYSHLYDKKCQDCLSLFRVLTPLEISKLKYELKYEKIIYMNGSRWIEPSIDEMRAVRPCNLDLVDACHEKQCFHNKKVVCLEGCQIRFTCGHVNRVETDVKKIDTKKLNNGYFNLQCSECEYGRATLISSRECRISSSRLIGFYTVTRGHFNIEYENFNENYD